MWSEYTIDHIAPTGRGEGIQHLWVSIQLCIHHIPFWGWAHCLMPTSLWCNWKQFRFFSLGQLLIFFFFIPLFFSQDRIIISSPHKPKPSIHCLRAFKSIKPTFWIVSRNVTFVPFQHNPIIVAQYFGGILEESFMTSLCMLSFCWST